MDPDRFDRIAKSMAAPGSRRRVLGGLLGGALGGLLARLGPEEAAATHAGCRHTGADCTRPGQCCSGRCAGNNTCQPCTSASQCPAPPASEPCKKRVCTSTGKCVIRNKAEGTACPDDGNACTDNRCDGTGTCIHPPKPAGSACTSDDNPCTDDVCNAAGECTHPNTTDGADCGDGKTCQNGVCRTPCTPTTCAAIYQEKCRNPDDCGDYGICGPYPDGCGGTLDCGGCRHSCFACEDGICVFPAGSSVCGEACCVGRCCADPSRGVCGDQPCLSGTCCPLGFSCCNATDGTRRSSCYNIQTYCQGRGLYCCSAGNTCCTHEPCCTDTSQCKDGRRCVDGCCSYTF